MSMNIVYTRSVVSTIACFCPAVHFLVPNSFIYIDVETNRSVTYTACKEQSADIDNLLARFYSFIELIFYRVRTVTAVTLSRTISEV